MLKIKASGVTFETKTGRASTDKDAAFEFDSGEGKSLGASYDPQARELHLRKNVELWWRGNLPPDRHMKVEAGEVFYKEDDSVVLLQPWSRFRRGPLTLDAAISIVTLDNGEIRLVDAQKAKGTDRFPRRDLEYEAEHLLMNLGKGGVMERIMGEGSVRLAAVSPAARTLTECDRVDMTFEAAKGDSLLKHVFARGKASVTATPAAREGAQLPETRVLRSEVIEMKMKTGGEEIDTVETHAPGEVEFLPNREGQRHRKMQGERISIQYAEANRIRSFHAVDVATRTRQQPQKGKPSPPDALTWSKLLEARFDAASGQLAELQQSGDFRYEEGDRRGHAEQAKLEQLKNLITLTGGARLWDAAGATSAAVIFLNQDSGDMTAEGEVRSIRQPEAKKDPKKPQRSLLDPAIAMQAVAERMMARDRNQWIRYEGKAKLWQGSDRIEADAVEINRKSRLLNAWGSVISQFVEKPKKPAGKGPAREPAPVFTEVRASEMTYHDVDRLAFYKGNVQLRRPGLVVTSKVLRAWLTKDGADAETSLDRAVADGSVVIVQAQPDRTRRGAAEHAVYELKEEKMTLEGGAPLLEDSLRGASRGRRLTWYAAGDRLLVDGAPNEPAVSRINRKK
jgi:lipopolysaccharide export system protein LptA